MNNMIGHYILLLPCAAGIWVDLRFYVSARQDLDTSPDLNQNPILKQSEGIDEPLSSLYYMPC
jgi:hypothetical protein